MAVEFKGKTKHGTLTFYPGVVFAFKDARAEEYFIKAGWASKTSKKAQETFPKGSVEIDPETVVAGTGNKVLG
jgi:hypothetical protein